MATQETLRVDPDVGEVLLRVENVELAFGGVRALNNVSFSVRRGEIFSIIGPNGAGKSSMLNCINGFYHPKTGSIIYKGNRRSRIRPHRAANQGIARTFQNIALFKGMSVLANIMTGRHLKAESTLVENAFFLGRARREELDHRKTCEHIIQFLEIQQYRKSIVSTLPYGLQKRVELGRALAAEPELLLLDEPMAGMNLEEKQDMARFILDVNRQKGVTICLIEHDMGVVMDLSDQIVVLDHGGKIGEGTPDEIRINPHVVEAYLGVKQGEEA